MNIEVEQSGLKVNMLDGDRPRETKEGDEVWTDAAMLGKDVIGKPRWHLKPIEKSELERKFRVKNVRYGSESDLKLICKECGKIFGDHVGTACPLTPPKLPVEKKIEPVYDTTYEMWFEPLIFRCPRLGEYYTTHDGEIIFAQCNEYLIPRQVMRPIPNPDPALMICNHAGKCKVKCVFSRNPHEKNCTCSWGCPSYPDARCVPYVEPKDEPVHTTCAGCTHANTSKPCGVECWGESGDERKNYTPAPAPAPKFEDRLNAYAHREMCRLRDTCLECGMKLSPDRSLEDDMDAFIRDLHARTDRKLSGLTLNISRRSQEGEG